MTKDTNMIKIDKLKFKYAGSDDYAIDDISLNIPLGKFVSIVGHNGSGKSTLSKLIVGLYKPSDGYIELDGIRISRDTLLDIRKKIGIVFQNPENQFIGATVEDDIAFGLENKKISRKEMQTIVRDNAEKVGMLEFLDHAPLSLSGGQKQRVAIASILSLDPEIIIFDEVTSMLDPKGRREVLETIKKVQTAKNKTLISITHDMDEAVLSDEIIVLSKGKVIAQGNPQDILNNKEITDIAKIDAPFIYKVSKSLKDKGIEPTFDKDELVRSICK